MSKVPHILVAVTMFTLRARSVQAWSTGRRLSSSSRLFSVAPAADNVPKNFVSRPFSYHEEKTLRVVSLTNRGFGVCRTTIDPSVMLDQDDEDADNSIMDTTPQEWVIFVPSVIPGELVKMRIYRNFKNYSEADLVEVVEASPDRVNEPVCSLAHVCGGCQYQHMTLEAQREWKTRQVQEVLERVGEQTLKVEVSSTVGTEHAYHYRSKITPHYNRPKQLSKDSYEIREIGFQEKNSRRLVDIPYCHIASEAINEKLGQLREEKRLEAREGRLRRPKNGATLLLRDADQGVVTDHNAFVTTMVSGITFKFLAGNFFQNNPYMLPVMVHHVLAASTKPNGAGAHMTHLIDCYCGSGLFCLTAAASFDMCVGIEVVDKAVVEARANAALNSIENCAFVAASAEAIFESNDPVLLPSMMTEACLVRDFPRDRTVVVVDPPRKGCSPEFLEQLYEFGPQRIVYMSCDPATQARDAKGITEHGYEITNVQPFDLFPQTRHIECLVIFERR